MIKKGAQEVFAGHSRKEADKFADFCASVPSSEKSIYNNILMILWTIIILVI